MWPSPAAAGLAPPWHKTFPKDLYGKWWWRLWRMITSRPVGGWSLYEVRIKWLANKCQQDDFSRWCLIFRWSKNQDYDINDLHIYIVYIYIVNVHIMNHWIWQLRQHVHHHMIIIYSYHNLSYQYNYNPLLWCCCLATSNVQAGEIDTWWARAQSIAGEIVRSRWFEFTAGFVILLSLDWYPPSEFVSINYGKSPCY